MPPGDAGAVLDARAKAEYRRRLDDLAEGLREAESFRDASRAQRFQAEIDALAEQLAGAVGLGGRDLSTAIRKKVISRLPSEPPDTTDGSPEAGKTGSFSARTAAKPDDGLSPATRAEPSLSEPVDVLGADLHYKSHPPSLRCTASSG